MPLVQPPEDRTPTAGDGVARIKLTLFHTANLIEHSLDHIREVVREFGRAEIEAELGEDAHELASVYRTLKETLENLDPQRDVRQLD